MEEVENTPVEIENISVEVENTPVEVEETTSTDSKEEIGFVFREKRYKFADDAPEIIFFGGENLTQEEIIKNEDVLVHLIGGNSHLIERF